MPWENHETANTVDWVPKGYAVVKIDERGSNNTPGDFNQFSCSLKLGPIIFNCYRI